MAKWIAQHFPDNGVYLEVIKDNQQAVKFYDHIGGQLVQERMWKAPCGSQVPELVYAWKSGAELLERISIHTQTELVTD